MGRLIEKLIKKELINKPTIGNFTLKFEYRYYEDKEEKVIRQFIHFFNGYLMRDTSYTELVSKKVFLFDEENRKLFCFQLHPDSKIKSLNTEIIIESILQNILFMGELLKSHYEKDIDNVPLIPLTIIDPNSNTNALTAWKFMVASRFNLDISQCHEVILGQTMSYEDMKKLNIPDYQIIHSQRGDISLYKKL